MSDTENTLQNTMKLLNLVLLHNLYLNLKHEGTLIILFPLIQFILREVSIFICSLHTPTKR